MTNAISGVGASLRYGDAETGSNFSPIDEVLSISGFELLAELIEVSSLDSAGYKENIAALLDGGSLSFEANWTKSAAQIEMRNRFASKVRRQYRMVLPDTDETTFEFVAFVESFTLNFEPGAAVTISISLKVTSGVEDVTNAPAYSAMTIFDGSSYDTAQIYDGSSYDEAQIYG